MTINRYILSSEFCESVRDGTHDTPKRTNSGYRLVTSKHIKNGQINSDEGYFISVEDFNKINERSLVEQWDVLMSMIGTIGEAAIVKDQPKYAIKNVALFKCGDELKAKWLYYFLCSPEGKGQLFSNQKGASQQFISLTQLRNLQIPIRDQSTMKKITDILSAYDDLIENNQKQIKLLEEAAMRLYKEWFVKLRFPEYENTKIVDGVPEGWERNKLIEIADIQYGFAFDSSKFNILKKGTPIIRIRNIPSGNTSDYTTEHADEQYLAYNGDIIVGMDGEFHINTWAGDTAYLVQRTCRIKPKNTIMKGYLLQAIYEPIKYFEKTITGATVAHLGKKHIDTITLLTAPEKYYLPFQYLFDKRQILLKQNVLLQEARDKLLPKLMSGEIEV